MNIAICDDVVSDINVLKQLLLESKHHIELFCFTEADAFFNYVSDKKNNICAVIIDIELANSNGIKVANKLKSVLPDLPVIFYTAYVNKYSQNIFLESLALKPFALITKPPSFMIVEECLNQLLENEKRNILLRKNITFKTGTTVTSIKCMDINYIESMNHHILVHTNNDVFTFSGKLKNIYNDLPHNFSFCHKSYIVNLEKVIRFTSTQCQLVNGEIVPVSRSCKENFKNEILLYKIKYE